MPSVAASIKSESKHVALRGLLYLLTGTVLVGLILAGPAYYLAGTTGLLSVLASVGVCLFPGLAVVLLVAFGVIRNPLHSMLFATGLRMLVVLAVVLVVKSQSPDLRFRDFYVWVVLVYLAALAAETLFISRRVRDSQAKGF